MVGGGVVCVDVGVGVRVIDVVRGVEVDRGVVWEVREWGDEEWV